MPEMSDPLLIHIDTPQGPHTLIFWGTTANKIRVLKSMYGDHIIQGIIQKFKEQYFPEVPKPFEFTKSPIW